MSVLRTPRLALSPISPGDADAAFPEFADPGLYRWMTGAPPASAEALREEFARLAAGSPREGELWLNWLARRFDDGVLVGWHQATVIGTHADVAWVTFGGHRRRGYAREGAAAMIAWLAGRGVRDLVAQADLRNEASAATAASLGFVADARTVAESLRGEATVDRVWRLRV